MKYILITGAGGGMGQAAVDIFVHKGYRVFALDMKKCPSRENVIPLQADVTDGKSVAAALETVSAETSELCGVIHLAGIYMLDSLVEISPEEFERAFRINIGGAFLINRTFLPLLQTGAKVIMLTSELAVRDPLPFTGLYGITKTALDRYAYSLRMELQLLGISVSVLRAGAVDTGMIAASTRALFGSISSMINSGLRLIAYANFGFFRLNMPYSFRAIFSGGIRRASTLSTISLKRPALTA